MKLRAAPEWLLSPALPAAGVLYGILFCLAGTHFKGGMWSPLATKLFFGVFFVWVGMLAWKNRHLLQNPGLTDKMYGLFILGILLSLLAHGEADFVAVKYLQFVPFLAVLPYIAGRIMTPVDIKLLMHVFVWVGPLALLLAAIDYSQSREAMTTGPRWIFFDTDHSPLLLSFMLSASLIAASFMLFSKPRVVWRQAALLVVQVICVAALVFVAARGVLLGAVLGVAFMMFAMRGASIARRAAFLGYLSVVLAFSFSVLPNPQSEHYAKLMTGSGIVNMTSVGVNYPASDAFPILGEAACKPFAEGQNSVAMRWVLYKEAVSVFMSAPWVGVGPASFGRHSCVGVMGYPHSTVLQSFAELGVVGGLLFVGLMACAIASNFRSVGGLKQWMMPFMLGMLVQFLATDQLYGNYFMAAGTYFWVGVSASVQSNSERSPPWGNENA